MKNFFKEIYQNTETQNALNKLLHSTVGMYNSETLAGSGLISVYMVKESELSEIKCTDFYINCSLQMRFGLYDGKELIDQLDDITIACAMYVSTNGNRIINLLLYSNHEYLITNYEIEPTSERWQKVYDYFKNKIRNERFKDIRKEDLSVMIGHF